MQVRQEAKKLKGGVSAAALAALSAAAVMVALSLMVTTRALALIPSVEANSTLQLDLPARCPIKQRRGQDNRGGQC
jgi:hypothetical protein